MPMKRILALIIASILAASLMSGCNGEVKIYSETDKIINTRAKQEFIVMLDSSPSTGYQWQEETYDESMFKLLRSTYEVSKKYEDGKEENGLAQSFRFKALKKGGAEITLVYKQPSASVIAKRKVFSVNIE